MEKERLPGSSSCEVLLNLLMWSIVVLLVAHPCDAFGRVARVSRHGDVVSDDELRGTAKHVGS